jgi:hypothetical protein
MGATPSEPTLDSAKSDAQPRDRGLGGRDPSRARVDKSVERRFSRLVEVGALVVKPRGPVETNS